MNVAAVARQRRRFGYSVASLNDEELATASRCEGWTVADVLRHGIWVDATMRRIWSGDRSSFEGFDPCTTPNDFVESDRMVPDEDIRRRYLLSTEAMVIELESGAVRRSQRDTSRSSALVAECRAPRMGFDRSRT
jgi:uncharacterized protein (TIGR03083 family)